ncbi:MAG TPA: glycosyltransferase family A protein [Anaerolineales bacterium]|nr:glycosyltransferase family A protein [Anaerolineales bacterium]HLO30394.1 glycosyltransferase family A protein [Anaerolineales bacterium]
MKTSSPSLVSVIIIFFNAGRFIQEAIESVFAQTYQQWELLLVDDGSIDESTMIAHQYADCYPERVRYLEHYAHVNHGMSASRNLGIRNSCGKFIAFLDADDIWLPNILEDQVAILESQPEAAMVYGTLLYWYSWTGLPEDRSRDYVEKLGVEANSLIQPPKLLPLFLQDHAAVPSGIMIHREAIERYGAFEETFKGEYEDQAFCAKICLNAPVFASDSCWYLYRQHADSCVAIGQRTRGTDSARLFFLNWLARYLSHQKVKSPIIWWALHNELLRSAHPRAFQVLKSGLQVANQLNERLRQGLADIWNPS